MIIKGLELGTGLPKICVPLVGKNKEALLSEIDALKECSYDLIEWRIDFYDESLLEALPLIPQDKPLLVTFRTSQEGGNKAIEKADYKALYKELIDTGLVDLIDIELDLGDDLCNEMISYASSHQVKVILSHHHFSHTDSKDEIINIFKHMDALHGDILKVAYMPTCKEDVLNVILATSSVQTKGLKVSMSMSKLGFISRVVGEFSESCITFGSVKEASAPGQISANKLKTLLEILHEGL